MVDLCWALGWDVAHMKSSVCCFGVPRVGRRSRGKPTPRMIAPLATSDPPFFCQAKYAAAQVRLQIRVTLPSGALLSGQLAPSAHPCRPCAASESSAAQRGAAQRAHDAKKKRCSSAAQRKGHDTLNCTEKYSTYPVDPALVPHQNSTWRASRLASLSKIRFLITTLFFVSSSI